MDMEITQKRRRQRLVTSSVTDIKKIQPEKRVSIPRKTRKFQLRVGERYPIDMHVAEILDYKRQRRSEVTAIRDGVRLLWALENDDLSVLFEMFPHLKSRFTPPDDSGAGQLDEIKGLLEVIAANQKNTGYTMQSAQPAPLPGLQPLTPKADDSKVIAGFKPLALPAFDDEDDELPTLMTTKNNLSAVENFMRGLDGLTQH